MTTAPADSLIDAVALPAIARRRMADHVALFTASPTVASRPHRW